MMEPCRHCGGIPALTAGCAACQERATMRAAVTQAAAPQLRFCAGCETEKPEDEWESGDYMCRECRLDPSRIMVVSR